MQKQRNKQKGKRNQQKKRIKKLESALKKLPVKKMPAAQFSEDLNFKFKF